MKTTLYFLSELFMYILWGEESLNLVNLLSILYIYFVICSGGHLAGDHGGLKTRRQALPLHSLSRFSERVTQNMLRCALRRAGC